MNSDLAQSLLGLVTFIWLLLLTGIMFYLVRRPRQAAQVKFDCLCGHSIVMHRHSRPAGSYGECAHHRSATSTSCRCQGYHGPLPPEDLAKQLGLS